MNHENGLWPGLAVRTQEAGCAKLDSCRQEWSAAIATMLRGRLESFLPSFQRNPVSQKGMTKPFLQNLDWMARAYWAVQLATSRGAVQGEVPQSCFWQCQAPNSLYTACFMLPLPDWESCQRFGQAWSDARLRQTFQGGCVAGCRFSVRHCVALQTIQLPSLT